MAATILLGYLREVVVVEQWWMVEEEEWEKKNLTLPPILPLKLHLACLKGGVVQGF